ncbi:MAG: hypothetical protein NC483_04625 [Ruminococcus sp.]|nr:hypothetical protein [Ruminococcus sp.]
MKIVDILKVLHSFNINSKSYGPSIYQKDDEMGICLDIKDNTFGFLTRAFTFSDIDSLDDFLKKYSWYKKNKDRFNVELKFDSYSTKTPKITYLHNDHELTFDEMINLKEIIEVKKERDINEETKAIYLRNIEGLTNYLIELKKKKYELKLEKNNLKIEENNLKFSLLEALSKYYNQQRVLIKKNVTLDNIVMNDDNALLENNLINIKSKSLEDVTIYLNSLIDIIKHEELDRNYLLNMYSNLVYKYNIDILNKQINFVNNKIVAEQNFNIQGSAIHNIDEELKSFLKTNIAPPKLDIFLREKEDLINNKFSSLTDIKNAYNVISGTRTLIFSKRVEAPAIINRKVILDDLKDNFEDKTREEKASLILYNSFYKNICNYIIDNNYPDITDIKKHIDIQYYYEEFSEIVYNTNNNHYLVNYFSVIDFKSVESFIASLVNISHTLENSLFSLISPIKAFTLKDNSTYKFFTLNPLIAVNEKVYLVDIPYSTPLVYIPEKIILDSETKEFSLIKTENVYLKGNIEDANNLVDVHYYQKKTENDTKNDIIITNDLILKAESTFHLGVLKDGY